MDILIGFAVAALKAGVSGALGKGIVQALADQGINIGSDKLRRYLEKSQKELSQVLTDKSLLDMKVPKEYIDYVKEEIKELIQSISLDEDLFRDYGYDANSLAEALYEKYKREKKDYVDYEGEIQKVLYVMSEKAISLEIESDRFAAYSLVHIMETEDEQIELLRKIFHILDVFMKTRVTNSENDKGSEIKKRLPDRTEEYRRKWTENMFLNNFDPDDKNAGVNIPLCKLYQTSFYRLKGLSNNLDNLEERLERCTQGKDTNNRMLLILGQPGMGKSTMITWFTAQYQSNTNADKKEILVYKFTDLNIDWSFSGNEENDKKIGIASAILNCINIEKEELNGKILILDGFDEILVSSNNRAKILNSLFSEWALNIHIKDFSLLVTCRENYIEDLHRLSFPYISLQPWDEEQIENFCINYKGLTKNEISEEAKDRMKKMKDVFGIPIILYMTLALDITVKEESSVVEVYDQIFSLEGGIYDRCLKIDASVRWDDKHRISAIKKQIHQFSREISIWMFENNPQNAEIPKDEYEKIWHKIYEKDEVIDKELIGNYFKVIRCYDGIDTEWLTFVHRSIYEYFVAEMISSEIKEAVMTTNVQVMLAGVFGYRLKKGKIDFTIGQYLKAKVIKSIVGSNKEKKNQFYLYLEEAFDKMLGAGMLYYTGKSIKEYRNVIEKEMKCFLNFMDVLRLFLDFTERKYILQDIDKEKAMLYIRYLISYKKWGKIGNVSLDLRKIDLCKLDLSEIDLSEGDLSGVNLRGADLSGIILKGGNLRRADLREANLSRADLSRADLGGADLSWADLSGADLRGTDLGGANLSRADLSRANLREEYLCKVYLRGTDLRGADLRKVNLSQVDLNGADLSRADLSGADLYGADLRKSKLDGADLSGANLGLSKWSQRRVKEYIRSILQAEFYMIYSCTEKTEIPLTHKDLLAQCSE